MVLVYVVYLISNLWISNYLVRGIFSTTYCWTNVKWSRREEERGGSARVGSAIVLLSLMTVVLG